MSRVRRRDIDRLTLQIDALDAERRRRTLVVDEGALTEAEQAFCAAADRRGKRVLRNGWPDFMVFDLASGGILGVEVKTDRDEVSEAQARMFEALEMFGLRVMIWNPARPEKLYPWRRHDQERRKHAPNDTHWAQGSRPPGWRVRKSQLKQKG